MAISKITLNGEVQMDVTQDTVTANNLLSGETATGADGVKVTGVYTPPGSVTVTPLSVTTNGTYTAPSGSAYSPVTVNVEGGGSASDDVLFIDYDGTIVNSYSADDFANLSALPSNPSHSGLTSQGWNWSLSDAKTYVAKYGQLTIGQMYITDDGKTRIHIHLEKGRTSPILGCCPNGTVVVDWGDGSATDTLTGTSLSTVQWTPTHNYASAGDYVISLEVLNGTLNFSGTTNPTETSTGILLNSATLGDSLNPIYKKSITSIELGSNINAYVASGAFAYCYNLTSVTMPNTIMGFYYSVFIHCHSLKAAVIPSSATNFAGSNSGSCFSNCFSLKMVSFPNGMTNIGGGSSSNGRASFEDCRSLTRIAIPESVTSIGSNAFSGCSSLTKIIIPENANTLRSGIFQNNYALRTVSIRSLPTNFEFFGNCYALSEVNIPDSVTSIGTYALTGNRVLSSINLRNNITKIDNYAFQSCVNLKKISTTGELPDELVTLGTGAFASCSLLTGITKIPNGITQILSSTFSYCSSLNTMTFHSGITSIQATAFTGCYGLTEIHFLSTTPPTVANANAWTGIPTTCKIYVPTGTLSAYTSAANYPDPATYTYIEE